MRRCLDFTITSLIADRFYISLAAEALVATLMADAGSNLMYAVYAGVTLTVLLLSRLVHGRSVIRVINARMRLICRDA